MKIVKNILLPLLTLALFSCENVQDDLFGQPASIRLERSREETQKTLESAQQGWVFQYFPIAGKGLGGYNMHLVFREGRVTARLESNPEETSLYSVQNRGGNVLSFDDNNAQIHHFANISSRNAQIPDVDYEFLVLSVSDKEIILKGLRTGEKMRMFALTESYDQYLEKVNQVNQILNGGVYTSLTEGLQIVGDGKKMQVTLPENGNTVTESFEFVPTDSGIRFQYPITIDGQEYTELSFEKSGKVLLSEDQKLKVKILYAPIDFQNSLWSMNINDEAQRSAKIKEVWDAVAAEDLRRFEEDLSPEFRFGVLREEVGLHLYSLQPSDNSNYRITVLFKFAPDPTHTDYIHITNKGEGFNYRWYKHFAYPIPDLITNNSPYRVEMDNPEAPTRAKLISVSNPNVWFVIAKKS